MSIKGGDNFDLLPDRIARDMEAVFGKAATCENCRRGHKVEGAAGQKRCGLLERMVRDDETCNKHIAR